MVFPDPIIVSPELEVAVGAPTQPHDHDFSVNAFVVTPNDNFVSATLP
ncbi:MAG: hypothetical protein WCI00_00515 [bacterium]